MIQLYKKIIEDSLELCDDCSHWGSEFCIECLEEATAHKLATKNKKMPKISRLVYKSTRYSTLV